MNKFNMQIIGLMTGFGLATTLISFGMSQHSSTAYKGCMQEQHPAMRTTGVMAAEWRRADILCTYGK